MSIIFNLVELNKKIEKNDELKLIVCLCEEAREEYNKEILEFKEISCLILNFDSKSKDLFIKKYNIISLPILIILDKDGELIDTLNKDRIFNLNESDIIGWKNKFIIPNIYKNKVPELGERANITKHEHELVYSNHSMKPGYGKGGWICDILWKSFSYNTCNYFCSLCGFDICDVCFDNYKY